MVALVKIDPRTIAAGTALQTLDGSARSPRQVLEVRVDGVAVPIDAARAAVDASSTPGQRRDGRASPRASSR